MLLISTSLLYKTNGNTDFFNPYDFQTQNHSKGLVLSSKKKKKNLVYIKTDQIKSEKERTKNDNQINTEAEKSLKRKQDELLLWFYLKTLYVNIFLLAYR